MVLKILIEKLHFVRDKYYEYFLFWNFVSFKVKERKEIQPEEKEIQGKPSKFQYILKGLYSDEHKPAIKKSTVFVLKVLFLI